MQPPLTIEQQAALQQENIELKQDFAQLKKGLVSITDAFGISTKGVFEADKMDVGKIVKTVLKELGTISKNAMLPDFMKSKNNDDIITRFAHLKDLFPIIEKYKHL